jgi:hypothetical protein
MTYLVQRRKDNIQAFLRYKGLTNANVIKNITFKMLAKNIAKISIDFNYNYMELKWNIDVRNCHFYNTPYRHIYKTKKDVLYYELPTLHLEFNWDIDSKNIYPEMSYTFFNIQLYPETQYEKNMLLHYSVLGWNWYKYGVEIIIGR